MKPPLHLAERFEAAFGSKPSGIAFASGRVNLIGEHIDYNGGMVLPMPISSGTFVAWSPRNDNLVRAIALDFDGEQFVAGQTSDTAPSPGKWSSYVQGMLHSCRARGLSACGADLTITGTMPRGSGLSSSASLCIAVGRALCDASGIAAPDQQQLALAAQATEHNYANVHCGIMDQMAIAHASFGHALALDCADQSYRRISLPADWAFLIVQSGVERGLVESEYNVRRSDCERAAAALGHEYLAQATTLELDRARFDSNILARARHVISEHARTGFAIAAVRDGDLPRFGELMRESHASLRDDFAVSVAPVDQLVDVLNAAIGMDGGARMTGGGFGGAVVAVLRRDRVEAVLSALHSGYRTPGGEPATVMVELPTRQ